MPNEFEFEIVWNTLIKKDITLYYISLLYFFENLFIEIIK
jgi:hypothetical protein